MSNRNDYDMATVGDIADLRRELAEERRCRRDLEDKLSKLEELLVKQGTIPERRP